MSEAMASPEEPLDLDRKHDKQTPALHAPCRIILAKIRCLRRSSGQAGYDCSGESQERDPTLSLTAFPGVGAETPDARPAPPARIAGELQALNALVADVLGHLESEQTLLAILNAAQKLVDADISGILLADADQAGVRMRACAGHRTVETRRLYVPTGQGVAGRVYATGQPFKVADYETDPVISRHFVQLARAEGKRSALGAPMFVRGRAIGTLMAWRRRPSVFDDDDVRILTSLASMAAVAILNADLFETERRAVDRLELANRQLEAQNTLLRRATEVHEQLTRIVLDGSGLHELTAVVAEHTAGRAAIVDAQLNELAATAGARRDIERAAAYLRHGPSSSSHDRTTITLPLGGDCPEWLLITPATAGGETIGYLIVALAQESSQLTTVIVEQAAIVCALQLTKEREVWEVHTRLNADLLWDMLEGNVRSEQEALMRASALGQTLPPRVRVLLVDVERGSERQHRSLDITAVDRHRAALARTVERAAKDGGAACAFAARRGSHVGLLIPGTDDAGETRRLAMAILRALGRAFPGLEVAIGVSASAPWTSDLRALRSQARSALPAVNAIDNAHPVSLFDDLGVLRFLLAPGDRSDLLGFARRVLGPVIDYDHEHKIDLVRTLDRYLASDCNLKRTAETMFMHAKTVRYRLDRVQELAGIDLASQSTRFDVQLALNILRSLDAEGDREVGAEPARFGPPA